MSLALGLTGGIILIGKIFYELSYDTNYPDSGRIHKVIMNKGDGDFFPQVSGAVVPGLVAEVPGIESATRTIGFFYDGLFKDEQDNEFEVESLNADPSFFDVFSTKILAGDPQVLKDPSKVMISRSLAEKLGGIEKVMGSVIRYPRNSDLELVVGGVYEDYKRNGSIHPLLVGSIFMCEESSLERWTGNENYAGYVKLQPKVKAEDLADAILRMKNNHIGDEKYYENLTFDLKKLPNIHRENREIKNAILILSIVAFLLLSISLLNYILVVISGLVTKSKEMAIRKCYGAGKKNIYLMLLRENIWQMVFSLLTACGLIFAGRGLIKDLTGYTFTELMVPESILAIGVTLALILLISIILPAKTYIAVSVDKALRGYVKRSRNWKLTLLGLQITINIFIIVFLLVVWLQHSLVVNFNPGYNTENILYTRFFTNNENYKRILSELEKLPEVENAGITSAVLHRGASGNNVAYDDIRQEDHVFNIVDIGQTTSGAFDILGIDLIQGKVPTQNNEALVSKSFVDRMNDFTDWKGNPLGRTFSSSMLPFDEFYTVSGVYDDILIGNLLGSDKRPSMISFSDLDHPGLFSTILIKVNQITPEILNKVQDVIRKTVDRNNLEVFSYSDKMKQDYDELLKMKKLLLIGICFSLLIAFMGLIGFLNDEANRRTKEIAIRKINGASLIEILQTFSSDIIKLSLASAAIAGIGVYILSNHWLTQFEKKIPLSPMIFIMGSLLIITLVMIFVLFKGRKISLTNPVNSLRTE